MLGTYPQWGFRACPFETRPLPATEEGSALLIGREAEVKQIHRRLLSPNKLVTVEGANGIGKTSVNNVATFFAYREFLDGDSDQLILPCQKAFQLLPDSNIEGFVTHVFLQVAITLIRHADELRNSGRPLPQLNQVRKWLHEPMLKTMSGALTAFGVGASAGKGNTINTGGGFLQAGFPDLVKQWLQEIFPTGEGGGVVCAIDNLELLRESEAARRTVEALRDEVLVVPGLRWILCGSTGIVRTLAATPRLQGYLHVPVELKDIARSLAGEILTSRVSAYRVRDDAYLPLDEDGFTHIHDVLRGNIRDALGTADDYCNWVADSGMEVMDQMERTNQAREWFRTECLGRLHSAQPMLTKRSLKLFDALVDVGGQCSPGDYGTFGFETPQAMRSQVLKLEAANLVKSVRDEEDNRRKTIIVTSNGWMVEHARSFGVEALLFDEDSKDGEEPE